MRKGVSYFDDEVIRAAAFARVGELTQVFGDNIPWSAISQGFTVHGEKILLSSRAEGIFKPAQMQRGVISIKTTVPREGRINMYADSTESDGTFAYALKGNDPNEPRNLGLRACLENRWPVIYFYAVAESVYKAIYPCFIEGIDTDAMMCRVSVAADLSSPNLQDSEAWRIERRYVLRTTKARLHQAEFRDQVLTAYGERCAMTALPVPELLEAVHIVPDNHELGVASIENGICLSRVHHRAFDANLIGVTPDYTVHVSKRLMALQDGVILESGLKALHGQELHLPRKKKNWPRKELLALRFEQFEKWDKM